MKEHHIYFARYTTPLPPDRYQALLRVLPAVMQEKAGRYMRWQDAHAYVLGRHLLLYGLRQAGASPDLSYIRYSDNGRPSLPGMPAFNISHSGNLVVCVISPEPEVGIDIELHADINFADFDRCFGPAEWVRIHAAAMPGSLFYDYWTAKEAVLKADGCGLIEDLQLLALDEENRMLLNGRSWLLRSIPAFEGYSCHLATADNSYGYTLTDAGALL
ncbi:4'-phosphopantetheinyl transferase family protein [Chitinophaga solisilvae]|uniref:4'-phosphopantetheinyl transferase family protein n=1 Tax=Chitinophaga solisilvae TaxID=1233460 RepID=UPI001369E9E3|nr:4'-phosphopantetheinyl transferase superfamily protein [Chitinophaga solisilvae]